MPRSPTERRRRAVHEPTMLRCLDQVERGQLSISAACRLGGFTDTTFYRWRARLRGEAGRQPADQAPRR